MCSGDLVLFRSVLNFTVEKTDTTALGLEKARKDELVLSL